MRTSDNELYSSNAQCVKRYPYGAFKRGKIRSRIHQVTKMRSTIPKRELHIISNRNLKVQKIPTDSKAIGEGEG